jgi:hypothetical protein
VIDPVALQMVLCVLTGWLDRREREATPTSLKEIGSCVDSLGFGDCA